MILHFKAGDIVFIQETNQGQILENIVQILEISADGILTKSIYEQAIVWHNPKSYSFHGLRHIPKDELKIIQEKIKILKEEHGK